MKRLLSIGFFTLIVFLFSSCFKEGSWYRDMDCVTKTIEVKTTLSPSELPPNGGKVPLKVTATKIVHYWQFDKEINTEEGPIEFMVSILNNPDGFELIKEAGEYYLICPVNNRATSIEVTLVVSVEGERRNYVLKQNPRKYIVDVEVQ